MFPIQQPMMYPPPMYHNPYPQYYTPYPPTASMHNSSSKSRRRSNYDNDDDDRSDDDLVPKQSALKKYSSRTYSVK